MGHRYSCDDSIKYRYYQIPKALLTPEYTQLTNDDRVVYAILSDRLQLSRKNGWVNARRELYIYFSADRLSERLGVSRKTVYRIFRHLKDAGLLEVERQGLGKPNQLYVCTPVVGSELSYTCPKSGASDESAVALPCLRVDPTDGTRMLPNDPEINETDKSEPEVEIQTMCPPNQIPPNLQSIRMYCQERGNTLDADEFFDYYTARGWHNIKDWTAAVRQCERYASKYTGVPYQSAHSSSDARTIFQATLAQCNKEVIHNELD